MTVALARLRAGDLVVFPTDTVYGLGGMPELDGVVAQIFRLKERTEDKPLPVLGASVEHLSSVVEFDDRALDLARRFWPGALSLVLPRAEGFSADLGGSGDGIAVRVPAHPVARELLYEAGPLAVTSANRSGDPAAQTIAQAREALGNEIAAFLDGGPCTSPPSTVLSLLGTPEILRAGPVDPGPLEG